MRTSLVARIHEIRNKSEVRKKYPLGLNPREIYEELRASGDDDPNLTIQAVTDEIKEMGKN
ncbi:MAG: hypothetical protein Q7S19_03865 [bacterium]|nr:hypothetical protein [bacterium]